LPDRPVHAVNYRAKLLVFVLAALAVLVVLRVAYSALETISSLKVIEADRDRWQRPSDVIRELVLRPGNTVADVGCGSGYFTLKLSPTVGESGHVIAEDIRRLPLAFLWARAAGLREHNVKVVLGDATDPHLPKGVDAVLLSNTYHEFADAHSILTYVYQSLARTGRLVIVDREPKPMSEPPAGDAEHEISSGQVQDELRQANFEVIKRDDHFIENDPYHENWWLIVARRTSAGG
jgi:ubiquinone/menaquinone biosynthesis C-methylase UbiE